GRVTMHKLAPSSVWSLLEDWSLPLVIRQLSNPTEAVFVSTPTAGQNQLLLDTLQTAVATLNKLQDDDPTKWTWGNLHTAPFRHSLDQDPEAASLTDLGPLPRPGDESTVNATGFDDFYHQVSGASYREIFDLSDWNQSLAVNSPGQSGQPGSSHYS